jgi:membrane protein DedA with SNARE-associated domain
MGNVLERLAGWASSVVETLGYPGIAFLVALESIFPPIPSEVVLPLTGFLIEQGHFSFPLVLLAALIGSMIGAYALFGMGRLIGEERVRGLIERYGKFLLLDESDLDRAARWFERHGGTAVFFGRLVPGVRSLISIPAGLERMPLATFSLYTLAGSAIWNVTLIGLGWLLGTQWERVGEYLDIVQWVVLAAVVVAICWFVVKRVRAQTFA